MIFQILTAIMLIVGASIPYLMIGFLLYLRYKRNKEAKYYAEMALKREEERNEREKEELALKKLQYQRKRCPYCGRYNKMDAEVCFSCAGTFSMDDDNTEKPE